MSRSQMNQSKMSYQSSSKVGGASKGAGAAGKNGPASKPSYH